MIPKFGIQCRVEGNLRWIHCAEGGNPLFFDTEYDRDLKLRELRATERRKRKYSKLPLGGGEHDEIMQEIGHPF